MMGLPTSKRQIVIGAGSLALVAVAGFVLYISLFPPTVTDVGQLGMACVQQANARCLFERLSEDEKSAYGLTEDKLQRLLDRLVTPALGAVAPSGAEIVDESSSMRVAALTQGFQKGSSTDTYSMLVKAKLEPDGIKYDQLMLSLFMFSFKVKYKEPGDTSNDMTFARAIASEKSALNEIGFQGMMFNGKFLQWDEIQGIYETRVAKGQFPPTK